MRKVISASAIAAMLLGAASASFGADRCITAGWPVACSAVATTGVVQQIALGGVSTAGSAVACLFDSRVYHSLASEGTALDCTKLRLVILFR